MIRKEDYPEMEEIWLSGSWRAVSIKDDLIFFEYSGKDQATDPVSIDWFKETAFLDALKKHFPEEFL